MTYSDNERMLHVQVCNKHNCKYELLNITVPGQIISTMIKKNNNKNCQFQISKPKTKPKTNPKAKNLFPQFIFQNRETVLI